MSEGPMSMPPPEAQGTIQEQLVRAVRDLWAMVSEVGENYVVFTDRRRLLTRVQGTPAGVFHVSWQGEDGGWTEYERDFDNLREAAFHAYQGPH